MSLEIILPDSLATEEYISFFMLFQDDNLESFFDNYAKDFDQDDESSMLDIYYISDILNDFVHALFTSIIQSSLDKEEYPAHLGDIIETWDAWYKRIKINCTRLIDKLPPEGKKKQLTEKMGEILQICKKIDRQTEHGQNKQIITEYDKALMENGLIDENLNAIHSAPEIARFLIDEMLMTDLKPEILQRYKNNGEPFKISTARKAVTYAKTGRKKKSE